MLASAFPRPGQEPRENEPPAVVPRRPTIAMLRAQQRRVHEAWGSGDARAYEQAVCRMGELVHDRAGIDQEPWNGREWNRQREELEDEYRTAIAAAYRFQSMPSDLRSQVYFDDWRAAVNRVDAARQRFNDLAETIETAGKTRAAERAAAYRAVIEQLRPLGGEVRAHPRSQKAAIMAVQDCADGTPTPWVEASNTARALYIRTSKGRAHYTSARLAPVGDKVAARETYVTGDPRNPPAWPRLKRGERWERDASVDATTYGRNGVRESRFGWVKVGQKRSVEEVVAELTVSGTGERMRVVARHEFGHRIESVNPMIPVACHEFLRRRTTTHATGQRMDREVIYAGTQEVGWRDDFVDHYVGRDYSDATHTEVFSMGSEAVWNGSYGGLVGEAPNLKGDLEHRNLILGLWASV